MTNQYVWIGIAIGLFVAGIGIGYVIFINTYNPFAMMMQPQYVNQMMGRNPQFAGQYMGYMMSNPQYMSQWMSQNPQYNQQWMYYMMSNPQLRSQMYSYMFQNQSFMYGMMSNPNFQNTYMHNWLTQNNYTWHGMMMGRYYP